jgi:hypothetical protein
MNSSHVVGMRIRGVGSFCVSIDLDGARLSSHLFVIHRDLLIRELINVDQVSWCTGFFMIGGIIGEEGFVRMGL